MTSYSLCLSSWRRTCTRWWKTGKWNGCHFVCNDKKEKKCWSVFLEFMYENLCVFNFALAVLHLMARQCCVFDCRFPKMKPNVCLVKCLLNSIAFKLTRDKFKGIKKIQYCILLNVQTMLIVLFHLHKLLFIYGIHQEINQWINI